MAVGTTNYPASLDTVVELVEAANNAADQLSGNISDSATSLTLMDGSEFAQSGIVAIDNELLSYTSRSGNTLNGLVRGIEGTTAAAHTDMSAVRQVITAASHNVQSAAIIALENKLGTGTDIAWSKMAPLTTNRMLVSDAGGDVAVSPLTHDATNAVIGNIGGLDFDTTPTATPTAARMVWDDTHGTVNLTLKGGTVGVDIGQTTVARVVNKTVTNINLLRSNYQVVRIVSAQGQRLAISLAQGDAEPNSTDVIGLVAEDIANNQEGFIVARGLITEINTTGSLQGETWADGDILYLSPTTAGGLTKVEPQAPDHLIIVGYVVYAHSQHGKIYVAIQTSWETKELHDVKITGTPAAGSLLIRNATTGVWENATLTAGSNITITNADKSITINSTASGSGDVVGPSSATDNALARFDTTTGKLIQNSLITLSDTGALSFPDGVRQTFNPNGTNAGINVGAHTSDPSSPTNGDLWYNSTVNQLKTRRGATTEVVATIPSNLGDEIPVLNATTGNLSATGEVFWDGSGNALQIGNVSTGALRLVNATGTDSFTLLPPATGGVVALTLPPGIGSNGQALTSNGTGGTSWTTITAGVSSVSGTSPVVSSGGSTPAISLASGYGDTQNPYASKTANNVLAGPTTGVDAAPTFRALVDNDIPNTLTLSKISNLTSNGFVKTSAGDGTLAVDTNTYLTGNQTITLTGDVTGSGATSITTAIAAGVIVDADINASAAISISKLAANAITIAGTSTSLGGSISQDTITGLSTTGVVKRTGANTLTAASIVNADIDAAAAIGVSKLAASTISGITLGNNLNALTIGTGLSGTTYNGSSATTIAIDSTVATLSGSQTLSNKTLSSAILTGTLTAGGGVGTSGQFLQSTATGVQWATVSAAPGGSNTQVQFNDGGVFGGDAGLVFDKTNRNLTVGATGTANQLRLVETGGGTDYVALRAPSAVTTSINLTLPGTTGSANQVLTTDGTGVLSWSTPASGDSYTNDTSTPTVTTADITGTVNTRYRFDISGLTNARDFILPAPSAVGNRIEINITTGDTAVGATNYELVLRGAWTGSSWVTINGGNASVSATVSAANDTITASRHNLRLGDPIYFTSAPGGLSTNTVYYVRDSAVNSDGVDSTFKVSATRGGAALDITSGTTATYVPLEWSRLFITGESVTLTATSTTNWQVTNDRRIPALVRLQATATQTFTAPQVTLNTNLIVWDNGAMGDLTTDRITIRRTGKYVITCAARITGSANVDAGIPNTLTRYAAWIRENGSAANEAYMVFGEMSATAGSLPAILLVTTGLLRRTNNYEVQLYSSNTSGIQTDARPYPHFAATEMLE